MKRIGFILISTLLILNTLVAQDVNVVLENKQMRIGEHNEIELSVSGENFQSVIMPPLTEIMSQAGFDIIENQNQENILDEDNNVKGIKQKLIFTAFDSAIYHIPAFEILKNNNGIPEFWRTTDSLMLVVTTVEVDTTQALKDIKDPLGEPIRFSEVLPYIITLFLAIIIALIIIYLFKKYKRKDPLFKSKDFQAIQTSVWALDRLIKLKSKKLWQQGFVKEYYVELTEIIRRYYSEEFDFNAMEMTSSEIITNISEITDNSYIVDKLVTIFSHADMAKFAKTQPQALDNENSLDLSVEIIQMSQEFIDSEKEKEKLNNQAEEESDV